MCGGAFADVLEVLLVQKALPNLQQCFYLDAFSELQEWTHMKERL